MNNKSLNNSRYEIPLSIVVFMLILLVITKNQIFIYLAFGIGLISLLSKTITNYIVLGWTLILKIVGAINAHVILGLVFFVILFPISMIYRILNKDSLNLKSGKESYFSTREHRYTPKDIENPW